LRDGTAPDNAGELLEQVDRTLRQALEAVSSLFGEMVVGEEHLTDSVVARPVDVATLTPRLSQLYDLLTKNSEGKRVARLGSRPKRKSTPCWPSIRAR